MLERLLLLCEKYPLDFVAHISSSLPVLVGLLRYKYINTSSKYIVLFFLFAFLKESIALWLSILRSNNLFLQNIESIAEIGILLLIALACFKNAKWRRIWILMAFICLAISIFNYSSNQISSASLSVFRLFSIFLCLSYFSKILIDVSVKNILYHSMFWFCAGLLIYSTGTFFIVLFSEYWYKDINKVPAEVFDKYWNASQILFVIFCCLSAYGLWTSKFDKDNLL